MSYIAGSVIVQGWTVLDISDLPLTGMTSPADVAPVLHRQSGSLMVGASEVVSWTEIGVTGTYSISFTPQNTGLYVLQLHEVNVNTGQRWYRFPDFTVVTAGSIFAPSWTNCFCAETDVERWLQQSIDSQTHPSDAETPAFAESRAAVLISLCARLGFTVTPATVTSGSTLQDHLREADAIGTAWDYTIAQSFGKAPFRTDRLVDLQGRWNDYVGQYLNGKWQPGVIEMEVRGNLVSLATDQIISGDTLPSNQGQGQDVGIQLGMGDVF